MITQSSHNTIIERVRILARLNDLENTPDIFCDINDFLYKLKSFDDYETMSIPSSIFTKNIENEIVFEWHKDEDLLSVCFPGDKTIKIKATYPSLDIKVKISFPLNEDMANFVTTHLANFKQPLKKKRYK